MDIQNWLQLRLSLIYRGGASCKIKESIGAKALFNAMRHKPDARLGMQRAR